MYSGCVPYHLTHLLEYFIIFFSYKYKGVETSLVVTKLIKSIANDLLAYNRQTQSKVLRSNAQELINFRSNYNM